MKPTSLLLVTTLSLFSHITTQASFASSLVEYAGTAAALQPVAPETLDKLLAPIALYPDPLVLQILQCAQSPEDVKKVNDWLKKNPDLKGTPLQDAATLQGFEPNFVAIVLFPQVLQNMADQPGWTRELGKAFTTDRDGVFASVQRLRTQAQAVGNLKSNEQQEVETMKTSSGQEVIIIQPANPQVVYVPTYNPTVVYTQAPPATSSANAAVTGLVGFTAGIIIGAAIADDNNSYYGCGGWGYRGPAMSSDGWNDYYDHRENMANDYYDHRENMASQRGENQSNRQDSRPENQAARQETSSANQAGRQEARSTNPPTSGQAKTTAASRGAAPSSTAKPADRSGTKSGAFSGYQSGTREREASSRGRTSTSRSSGGSRGGSRGGGRGR